MLFCIRGIPASLAQPNWCRILKHTHTQLYSHLSLVGVCTSQHCIFEKVSFLYLCSIALMKCLSAATGVLLARTPLKWLDEIKKDKCQLGCFVVPAPSALIRTRDQRSCDTATNILCSGQGVPQSYKDPSRVTQCLFGVGPLTNYALKPHCCWQWLKYNFSFLVPTKNCATVRHQYLDNFVLIC